MVNKKNEPLHTCLSFPDGSNINFISFHFKATTPAGQLICIKEYGLFAVKKPVISVRVTTLLYKSYRDIGYTTFHYIFAADEYRMGRVRSAIQKFVIK